MTFSQRSVTVWEERRKKDEFEKVVKEKLKERTRLLSDKSGGGMKMKQDFTGGTLDIATEVFSLKNEESINVNERLISDTFVILPESGSTF